MTLRRSSVLLCLALAACAGPVLGQTVRPQPLTPEEVAHRDAIERFLRGRLFAADGEFEAALREFRRAVELDPDDGHLRREYAEALRDFGVLPEAEEQARKAVELAPSSPAAHRVLGQILLARVKDKASLETAVKELEVANAAQPYEPTGAIALGQALLRLERPQEAAQVLVKVLDKARGPALPLLYAEAQEKSGQYDGAEETYQSILRIDPENAPATLGLLRVYQMSRRPEKGLPILEEMLKRQPGNLALKTQYALALLRARRLPEAQTAFEEILKADPGHREALRHYATLLSERLETDRADEVLRKLEAMDPDDPDIAFRRALNFLEARRLSEAEAVLKDLKSDLVARKAPAGGIAQVDGQLAYIALLKKDYATVRALAAPHLVDADGSLNMQSLNLLLQAARDAEDDAEGLRVAREAFAKAPKQQAVRSFYAEFLLRSGKASDKEKAEEILKALLVEDRQGALTAADTWQRLERFGRAAEVAASALETWKEDPDLLFRLGASLERDKKIPESVEAFERLLKAKPDHHPGLNYLGYMWADRNENLDRALVLIQKAVDLDPSNGAYLDSLGWIYYRLGKLDLAESNLKKAIDLAPEDSAVFDHLGDVYEKQGNVEKARELWKKALELKPDDGGASVKEKLGRTEPKAP